MSIKTWLLGWVLCGCAGIAAAQAPAPVPGAAPGPATGQAQVIAPLQASRIGSVEQLNGSGIDWLEKVSDEQYLAGTDAESSQERKFQ